MVFDMKAQRPTLYSNLPGKWLLYFKLCKAIKVAIYKFFFGNKYSLIL